MDTKSFCPQHQIARCSSATQALEEKLQQNDNSSNHLKRCRGVDDSTNHLGRLLLLPMVQQVDQVEVQLLSKEFSKIKYNSKRDPVDERSSTNDEPRSKKMRRGLLRTMNCLELQSLLAPPPDLKALGNIGST
jgi:hypothetical protein